MKADDIDVTKFDKKVKKCEAFMQPVRSAQNIAEINHWIVQVRVSSRGAFNATQVKSMFFPYLFDDIGEARKAVDKINAWAQS